MTKPVGYFIYDRHAGWQQVAKEYEHPPNTPLYLAPPKKEWVGLTDEEIKNSMRGHNTQVEFARAIEAKLKEKNNG